MLQARCAGSFVHAALVPSPARRVRSVVFVISPAGVDREDRTEPFETEFGQDYQAAGRLTVSAAVEPVGGATEEYEQRLARCPKRFAKRPPLRSRIVEGLSMGGVEIGMWQGEVEEQWGTPKSSACHGSSGAAPPGSPSYELGGMACDWDIQFSAGGVSSGLVGAFFGVRVESRRQENRVEELTVLRDEGRLPKYRRWKTSRGIGLGSRVEALKRAYGRSLQTVRFRKGWEPGDYDPYYLVTVRDGGRWVTVFNVAMARPRGNTPPPPAYVGDRVSWIEILPAASFRSIYRRQARPGWRP